MARPLLLMRRFTIRTRMLATLALVTLSLLAIGGVGVAGQMYSGSINQAFVSNDFASVTEIGKLRIAMGELREHEKDMIIQYENAVEAGAAKERWVAAFAAVEASAKVIASHAPNDASRNKIKEAMVHLGKFREDFMPIAKQLESMGYDSARVAAAFVGQVTPEYDEAQKSLASLAADMQAAADAGAKRTQRAADMVIALIGGATVIALLLIVPSTLLNARSICKPLESAEALAQAIAQGDLTERHVETEGHDEVAHLLQSLAGMQQNLREIVGQVRQSTDSISTASSEIASGNQDLSVRTEHTASNLQQTASSMDLLTTNVRQSADSARQANQLASSAAEVAARGGAVVAQVVATMNDINASSKKIADIIGVIDKIAFQTNILALNAAVEAARAGEQGRGFAVVAAEVRSLAGRSAEAAKEIKTLIGASVERVQGGSKLVADAGLTMTEIVGSVQRVTDIIAEITAAATEQSDGIGQVNGSVAELDQMTQQNAALVEESTAAAESLKEQAARLAQVVGTFRLDSSEPDVSMARRAFVAVRVPELVGELVDEPAAERLDRPTLESTAGPAAGAALHAVQPVQEIALAQETDSSLQPHASAMAEPPVLDQEVTAAPAAGAPTSDTGASKRAVAVTASDEWDTF